MNRTFLHGPLHFAALLTLLLTLLLTTGFSLTGCDIFDSGSSHPNNNGDDDNGDDDDENNSAQDQEMVVDLLLNDWSCESCAGDQMNAGHHTTWEVVISNIGTETVSPIDFAIRLIPEEDVENACESKGSYYYKLAKYVVGSGGCSQLEAGQTCTFTDLDVEIPSGISGDYKWLVKVDPYNELDEDKESNNSSCSSSWLTIVTEDEPEPEADEYDLSLHSVSCEDCISDDFQGGESTKWTVKLENSGDKTLYGADFEIRLVPQAYVESACSGGSYSYYTAKYVELGGDCYALYSGGGCAAVVYATVPNVSGDWYKWVIEADPYDAWDESNERNNRSCVNDWIYVY